MPSSCACSRCAGPCAALNVPLPHISCLEYAWTRPATPALLARDSSCLAAARIIYGAALLAFTIWSWATLSEPADFSDGQGNFGRTAMQLTTWGVVLCILFFLSAGVALRACAWLGTSAAVSAGAPLRIVRSARAGDALLSIVAALFVTAFTFEAAITILAWATFSSSPSLGSFIVTHIQFAPLLLDVAIGRMPAPWAACVWPLSLFAVYVFGCGMYAIAAGRTPYPRLDNRTGDAVAAIFISLFIIALFFAILHGATVLRERAIAARRA